MIVQLSEINGESTEPSCPIIAPPLCTEMEKLRSPIKEELEDSFVSHVDQTVAVVSGSGLNQGIGESLSCKIEKEIGNISLNTKEECESSSSGESESSSSEESESSSSEEDSDNEEDKGSLSKVKGKAKMKDVGQVEEGEIKDDESDEDDFVYCEDDDDVEGAKSGPIKSKNEVSNLPPVLPVEVTLLPNHQTLPVGAISSIFGTQVIVEGVEHEPLDESSILWITESRVPLGRIDEIFGPVKAPYYVVRYNSENEIPTEAVIGTLISYVPEFASHVLKNKNVFQKGYDASGEHDEEVSEEVEFSDDEKEAEYRRSLKMEKRGKNDQKHGNNKKGKGRGGNVKIDKKPDIRPNSGPGQDKIWPTGVSPGAPYSDHSVPQPAQPQHNVVWPQQNMAWPQQNMVWPQQNQFPCTPLQMFDFNQRMLINSNGMMQPGSQPGFVMGQGPWQQGYMVQNSFNSTPFGMVMPGQHPYPSPYGGGQCVPFQDPAGVQGGPFQNPAGGHGGPFQSPTGGQSVPFQNPAGGQSVPFQNPAGGQGGPFQNPTGGQSGSFQNPVNPTGGQGAPFQNAAVGQGVPLQNPAGGQGGPFQNIAGGHGVPFQNIAGGHGVPFQNVTGGQGAQFHNQYNGVQRPPTQNTGGRGCHNTAGEGGMSPGSNDHDEPPGFSSNAGNSSDFNLGRGGSSAGGRKLYRRGGGGGGRFSRGRGRNKNHN